MGVFEPGSCARESVPGGECAQCSECSRTGSYLHSGLEPGSELILHDTLTLRTDRSIVKL
jgi:hypothetical protein